ncbi:MAG: WYL domain-containing protein [Acidimicrobiia bacterium]|nr:WYL domain-containing protein [Acidimicrobiia bacterium]
MQNVIERLINLLAFLLTVGRPVSADEIRNTVAGYDQGNDDAFRRMFERDKDLLRGLGVPLHLEATDSWEVEYGYVVPPDDYSFTDPGLTDEERAALWLAAQVVRIGGQAPGAGAIFKLGGAPMAAAGEPLAADLGVSADDLGTAFAAVTERRTLVFTYRDKERQVDPYGLVHRMGHWYVVGHDHSAKEVRSFRVDRAQDLMTSENGNAFERPKGFRASKAISATPWEVGEADIEATVTFDASVAWWARRQLGSSAKVEESADGGLTVTMPVANPDAFIGWMLAFEDQAEITSPAHLRSQLTATVGATSD